MFDFTKEQWADVLAGYDGRKTTNDRAEKVMDCYVGEVATSDYLPRYSTREDDDDYQYRLDLAENSWFNWVEKVLNIWKNTIYRFTEAVRTSANEKIKSFMEDVNGHGLSIKEFSQDMVFPLTQIDGGAIITVDKPQKPDGEISALDQKKRGLFPYAFVERIENLVNYARDERGALDWVLIYKYTDEDDNRVYKYWDRESWALVTSEKEILKQDNHTLGRVPVILVFAAKNPKYKNMAPMNPLYGVACTALKIFNLISQLDQIIIHHAFPKIQMPESMAKNQKNKELGATNALVFADGADEASRASYLALPNTEIQLIISLIFDYYPNKILEMATIRDKTARPREESGTAKFMDSTDELANLLQKAETMERAEIEMVKLMAAWENITNAEFSIQYSKQFDIKGTWDQLREMVELFKEIEGQFPQFTKEAMKQYILKYFGNVDKTKYEGMVKEVDESFDPSLNLAQILDLIKLGYIRGARVAKMLNTELKNKSDEEVQAWIDENLDSQRGPEPPQLPGALMDDDTNSEIPNNSQEVQNDAA